MSSLKNSINVSNQVYDCLNLKKPQSFFLFAGAGSGKTRVLVDVLEEIKEKQGANLKLNGQQVAVITYTNAACDEINHRLEYSPLFQIKTIHSFSWELIKLYQSDIKKWLEENLKLELSELQSQQQKGRPNTKTAIDRAKKIESKTKRLDNLKNIKRFTYNPNGDNRTKDSLNHSEVISMTAHFLITKPLMRSILVNKFPILLIDESQDTNKLLMDAFFHVQKELSVQFSLGLVGDTMQRIYADGKPDLGTSIPKEWSKPEKNINHRSPKRIISLINRIRSYVDTHKQDPRSDAEEGILRIFIVSSDAGNKGDVEKKIRNVMADVTKDDLWKTDNPKLKILTLEHHMASKRMGFSELFEPLYKVDRLKTDLLSGTLSGLNFFTKIIIPLVQANKSKDKFAISQIVKKYSAFLKPESLKDSEDSMKNIKEVNNAVTELLELWKDNKSPKLIDILQKASSLQLFNVPESLIPIATRTTEEQSEINSMKVNDEDKEEEEDDDEILEAWDEALSVPFSQIEAYSEYISDKAIFGTHQGVKGLEYPHVMVIIDDEEARGFMFSYEKLLGAKAPTSRDIKNKTDGKETSLDRTRRLFYVICSRAQRSLAIVVYSKDPQKVKQHVLEQEWFVENEVVLIRGEKDEQS